MKKEKLNYFNEFINITNCISESTALFVDVIENYTPEKLATGCIAIHKQENTADSIVHKIWNYLITDFLPPLDREDITTLVHKLDNVEDSIDKVIINLKILNITSLDEKDVSEYTQILVQTAKTLEHLFNALEKSKNKSQIHDEIIEICRTEEQADRYFEKNMEKLFKEEKNPIEVIKWSSIYKYFEDIFDAFEGVVDCIEDIMLKNS